MSDEIIRDEETAEETVETVEKAAEAAEETVEAAEDTAVSALEVTEAKAEKKPDGPEMSKSKAKREARKAEVKAAKRKATVGKIIETVIFAAIAAVFVVAIVLGIVQSATTVEPGDDFSACLTDEGFIDGADLSSVKDLGLETLVIDASEVEPDDDTIQSEIDELVASYEYVDDDSSLTVADGDTINLDYVGYVDGEAFDGGDTEGAGTSLTIGSGSYVDDFEDQLIGTHPGDELTVEVTFPDDYTSEELQGKDATFEVTVNGIYTTLEFDDDFVVTYIGGDYTTAEEYRQYIVDTDYNSNLETYINDYITDNASVSKYPSAYVKNAKQLLYYMDEQTYEYYNSYYTYYLGTSLYSDFSDYTGMSDSEYQKDLKTRAKANTAVNMTYESVFKNNNLSISDETYQRVIDNYGEDAEDTYGKPYLMQLAMKLSVVEYLKTVVTVQ